jgi:acyl-CoA dehydrogenase
MDFSYSKHTSTLIDEVRAFMDTEVLPSETGYLRQIAESGNPFRRPALMDQLRAKARAAGLWNLFLQQAEWGGHGLSNVEFAPLGEQMGRSLIGPEVFNCHPPDSGNMSLLAEYGSPEQQQRWLVPLLAGDICSCFSITEPHVASSDAHNIGAPIERDGDGYVINAQKWFSTGAAREECHVCVFVGVTDPHAKPFPRQSLILIPLDTPGVTIVRTLSIFGYLQPISHGEIHFDDVRVPLTSCIDMQGLGFGMGQARLSPGRLHHCSRAIGMAERALTTMCRRVAQRETFGTRVADRGVIREWIARSRIEIEQARLLTLKAAWTMDQDGGRAARREIAAIKVVAPTVALNVLDRAIQAHGAAGVSQDTALAEMWAHARTLRILDGPDEVHIRSLGRWELSAQLRSEDPAPTPGAPDGSATHAVARDALSMEPPLAGYPLGANLDGGRT